MAMLLGDKNWVPKLRIELVPEPMWRINLRSDVHGLGKKRWEALRRDLLREQGSVCAICGQLDSPEAHEKWEYRETKKTGTATLAGIEIACGKCHLIHHWGRTVQLLSSGELSAEMESELIAHFMSINGCTEHDFKCHRLWAFAQYQSRSAKKWKVDWGLFREAVSEVAAERALRRSA